MRVRLLLAWRLQRWEFAALGVVAAAASFVALGVAFRLDDLAAACRAVTEVVAPCGGLTESGTIYDSQSQTRMYLARQALAVLPFAAGVILGVPLLARELELGTAQVAWPLARSRVRWLWVRLVPVAVIGVVLLAVPAMAAEVLVRSQYPVISPSANFEAYGERGVLPLLRFLPVLALAALVGAWIGRQLPALLVAGVLAGGVGFAVILLAPLWVEPVEQQLEVFRPIDSLGIKYVTVRYRIDGNWISDEEAYALMSWDGEGEEPDPASMPEQVMFGIPGERYPEVVLRESAALVGANLLLGGALVFVVRRRRPG